MTETHLRQIDLPAPVAAYFAASESGDPRAWSATLAEDAVVRDPVGAPEVRGRAAMFERLSGVLPLLAAFSGLQPDAVHPGGDSFAVSWHATATTVAGKDLAWSGISIFTVGDGGLIAAMDTYFDASIFA
ncbi:hypothetical protein GCM10009839_06650 [Catenulispora yoronensis]|uniref:SnoaL-like domain-containing protein n=1 Tax=Catenulispora yoronensis TaxID=450799 RepID=A0ABP5F2D2_9ACTN